LLGQVGDTPLLRLRRSVCDLVSDRVEIFAKAEWLNPGGSVKDRAALAMVLEAERRGTLTPGATLLDASSGNTGISYAMIAAARGYRLVLCLAANANRERKRVLSAMGAEVVLTDPLEGSDGAIREARRLAAEEPRWVYLNQYGNEMNWRAHYGSTGPEIVFQTGGRVTHFVATLGTSGTFVGTSRYLKHHLEGVVAVEAQPDSPFHGLEGLKHMESALVPAIYDPDLADLRCEVPTEEGYRWMRRLAALEGLLVGPSGGAAMWAAVQVARELEQGVVVTVFPDSGGRYLSEDHLWEAR